MEDELQPVDDGEFVYRRIHRQHFQPGIPSCVLVTAFRPTDDDKSGLSVFRQRFVQPVDTLLSVKEEKRKDHYVARLAVADLRKLGLSVVPDPDPLGPHGHSLIPELTTQAYHADKRRWKDLQEELAKLASADIVHRPDSLVS